MMKGIKNRGKMSILDIIDKKLKVAGHHYKVFYDDKYLNKKALLGQIDYITQKIRVCKFWKPTKEDKRKMRSKTDIERTIYHEILHSVDGMYNHYALTEKETDRLSVGLHQVMSDNFIVKVRK